MTKDIKLLALDVDGTLVQPDNRVAPDVRTAIADVAGAGLRVCLATGRSYVETVDVWQQLAWPVDRPAEAMAVVGGAMVVEPVPP
ncbi:MAG: HAD hydrolase family protein, partial [Phycisphaerae bacterium]|nr:HAD hydrolase family protein [Phycisphaerae bacterium]